MPTGDVEIAILDNAGAVVVVPQSSVCVVIGTCSAGTAAQVVASRDPNSLKTAVGTGAAVDLAALLISVGATVLFMKAAQTTAGFTGAVTAFATGSSVVTVTGTPLDSYLVKMVVTNSGTIATTGIRFRLSLDAGRNYGPEIALGTAVTFAVTGTGITLNFAVGTMVVTESVTFQCTEPLSSTANVQACIVALEASPYAVSGWGTMVITGGLSATQADSAVGWSGANISTFEGFLDTMVTTKTWTRALVSLRDAKLPVALWGGAGETEATWYASLDTDVSAVSAKRVSAWGGHYNIPSQYPVAACGLPRLRRPGMWAVAARQVTFGRGLSRSGPQTHAGRVSDGALAPIVVDPTNDPTDGFIYHDELNAPALDVARIGSLRKRKGKPGYFVVQPRLMAPAGSIFAKPQGLPIGNVADIGCALLQQANDENINADVRLNANGTIDETAAQGIEIAVRAVLRDNMLAKNMISDFSYVIDRTVNVRNTDTVGFAATLTLRGYLLEIDGTLGFSSGVGG